MSNKNSGRLEAIDNSKIILDQMKHVDSIRVHGFHGTSCILHLCPHNSTYILGMPPALVRLILNLNRDNAATALQSTASCPTFTWKILNVMMLLLPKCLNALCQYADVKLNVCISIIIKAVVCSLFCLFSHWTYRQPFRLLASERASKSPCWVMICRSVWSSMPTKEMMKIHANEINEILSNINGFSLYNPSFSVTNVSMWLSHLGSLCFHFAWCFSNFCPASAAHRVGVQDCLLTPTGFGFHQKKQDIWTFEALNRL